MCGIFKRFISLLPENESNIFAFRLILVELICYTHFMLNEWEKKKKKKKKPIENNKIHKKTFSFPFINKYASFMNDLMESESNSTLCLNEWNTLTLLNELVYTILTRWQENNSSLMGPFRNLLCLGVSIQNTINFWSFCV